MHSKIDRFMCEPVVAAGENHWHDGGDAERRPRRGSWPLSINVDQLWRQCPLSNDEDLVTEIVSKSTIFSDSQDQGRDDSGYASSAELKSLADAGLTHLDQCLSTHQAGSTHLLSDDEVLMLLSGGHVKAHILERVLKDAHRGVRLRRKFIASQITDNDPDHAHRREEGLENLPFQDYDFSKAAGRCAENMIGYIPVPVGIAGPLVVDGQEYLVPMATTEGALIASTARGCKALTAAGGVTTALSNIGMTRAPVIAFQSVSEASRAKELIESAKGWNMMKYAFESTTSHGALKQVSARLVGKYLYLRFRATTGEAMGMNITSKGTEKALRELSFMSEMPSMRVIALSGNLCCDKKPAAINWLEGRGRSVVAECCIPKEIVSRHLKSSVSSICDLNVKKNYMGSAMAGNAAGGFNAHAANIVAAIFLATGQDIAQTVTSSNCLTCFEEDSDGSLYAAVTLPSLEVGTVGGGTDLRAQASMLQLLGVKKQSPDQDGSNASQLARIIAATVLAGELSLCSALASGDLVESHMRHNRR